jgi:hypothetical protein
MRLRDPDEGHVAALEHLDQLREFGHGAAEAVDLVDQDEVISPTATSSSIRFRAGRSSVPPEIPPRS